MARLSLEPGSRTRHQSALSEPKATALPPVMDRAGVRSVWYRAHKVALSAWWFATVQVGSDPDLAGRFDLHERVPQPGVKPPKAYGTCYMGTVAEAAVREHLGHMAAGRPLTAAMLTAVVVSEIQPKPSQLDQVADVTCPEASDVAAGRELSSSSDYALCQRHAALWYGNGYTGILYWPRFYSGPGKSLAVFGLAGKPGRARAKPARPAADVLAEVLRERGGLVTVIHEHAADIEE